MTDAEKMREAAADICRRHSDVARHKLRTATVAYDADIWGAIATRCDMLHDAIRALPTPDASAPIEWGIGPSVFQPKRIDASAPAADCQQAGLVTVDAGLLDEVKRLRRALNESMETLAEVKRNMWRDASGQCDRDDFLNRKIVQRITAAIAASRAALARVKREVG